MTYYYKIFGTEVFIHREGTDFPVRIQVNYPSGKPFESLDEAKAWAESYILYITDPTAPDAATPVNATVFVFATLPTSPEAATPLRATVFVSVTDPTAPLAVTPVRATSTFAGAGNAAKAASENANIPKDIAAPAIYPAIPIRL
jgi:hypothetical protein